MNFIALLFEAAVPVRLLLVNNEVYLVTYTQGSGVVYVMVVENKRKRLLTKQNIVFLNGFYLHLIHRSRLIDTELGNYR